jgi:hypothetical protein
MNRQLPALVQRRSTMTMGMLNDRAVEMDYHLRLGTFDEVFVIQLLEINPANHEFEPTADSRLGPEFELEMVTERQLQPLFKHRISRLKRVDLSRVEPRAPDEQPKFPPFKLPVPAGESPISTYLREYIQNLP